MLPTMIDPPSPNSSSRGSVAVDTVVLHATAGGFAASLSWLRSRDSGASCHYLISKRGYALQLVPEHRAAWHAGRSLWLGRRDLNSCSIGIELENANDGADPYPDAQLHTAAHLIRRLRERYPIPLAHIVTHAQIATPRGRKSDPAGLDMPSFLLRVLADTRARRYRIAYDGSRARSSPYVRPDNVVRVMQRGDEVLGAVVLGGPVPNRAEQVPWIVFVQAGQPLYVYAGLVAPL